MISAADRVRAVWTGSVLLTVWLRRSVRFPKWISDIAFDVRVHRFRCKKES